MPDDPTVSLADLQLSSLHALLAALLSSARMRPPYFGRALEFSAKVGDKLVESLLDFVLVLY